MANLFGRVYHVEMAYQNSIVEQIIFDQLSNLEKVVAKFLRGDKGVFGFTGDKVSVAFDDGVTLVVDQGDMTESTSLIRVMVASGMMPVGFNSD